MGFDYVVGYFGRDVQGKIPGYRHQQIVDPHHRVLQAILGGLLRVIDLLCDTTPADTVAPAYVYHPRLVVTDYGDMVHLAIPLTLGVLVGPHPAPLPGPQRVIQTQRILVSFRAPAGSAHRPAIHLETTGHDTVVTARGDDIGILRWQGYLVLWLIERL